MWKIFKTLRGNNNWFFLQFHSNILDVQDFTYYVEINTIEEIGKRKTGYDNICIQLQNTVSLYLHGYWGNIPSPES